MALLQSRDRRGWIVLPVLLALVTCTGATDRRTGDPQRAALADPSVLSAEVTLAPGTPVASHGRHEGTAVATGADVKLVVWSKDIGEVRGSRVRLSDGAVLDPTGFQLSPATGTCSQATVRPAVAFTAGVFLVSWVSFFEVCAVRVRPDGTVLDVPARVVAASRRDLDSPAIAGDGTNFLIVWGDGGVTGPGSSSPASSVDIRGGRVRASDGASLDGDGFVIADKANVAEKAPAVTFDGTNFFVAWSDPSTGVVATRIRPSDRVLLDVPAVRLSDAGTARPSVAFNGTHLVAVWDYNGTLVGRRVNPASGAPIEAGQVTMRGAITSPNAPSDPAVSHDGSGLAVVWRGLAPGGGTAARLNLLRFDNALAPVGTPVTLETVVAFGTNIWSVHSISSSGGKHHVAWTRGPQRQDDFNNSLLTVHGASVDGATGTASAVETMSRQLPRQNRPSVSFDGRQHLTVWQEWNGTQFQIRGARFRDSDGELLDPNGITLSPAVAADQVYGQTASNGTTHLVIWWDGTQLRGVRLRGDDGAILDTTPLTLPGMPGVWAFDSPRFHVASDGTDFLVLVAEGGGSGGPISLSSIRVRADGTVVDATPRAVTTPVANLYYTGLAYVQSRYVAVWVEAPGSGNPSFLRARLIEKDGTPVDPVVTVAQASAFLQRARVAAMGGVAAISWYQVGGDRLTRVRVSDGALLAPQATVLQSSPGSSYVINTAAAFDGEHLLTVTYSGTPASVRLQRVTPDGVVVDTTPVVVSPTSEWGSYDLALSPSPGRRTLLAYTRFDPAGGSQRLRFRWLGTLPPLPPVDAALPPVDAAAPPVDAPVPPPVDAPMPPPVDAPVPPPVDAPSQPSVDAPMPPPVDAPAVDAGSPEDAGAGTDVAMSDSSTSSDTKPADGAANTTDTGTSPTDARLDARDGAGDARDGSRDGGGDEEEPACDCDLGGRPAGPGSGSLAAVLALALVGGRRSLRRRRK